MFGMGMGRIGRMGGIGSASGSGSLAPKAFGALITFWGDGVNSEGAAQGLANWPSVALAKSGGALSPSEAWMQCKSGDTLTVQYNRRLCATKQAPDIFVVASAGHNDGIYASSYATPLANWTTNGQFAIDNLPSSTIIVFTTPLTSAVAAETLGGAWATTVGNLIRAQVAAWQATYGSRIMLFDTFVSYGGYGPWDHTIHSNDADKTHPNALGGYTVGSMFWEFIKTYCTTQTKEAVLADTASKTWRGANIYAEYALSGTAGAKSGTVAPTGNVATTHTLTNNLTNGTSVAVTAAKVAQSGYDQQTIDITGTPAATQTVRFARTSNMTVTGCSPGAYFAVLAGVKIKKSSGAGGAVALNNIGISFGSIGSLFSGAVDLGARGMGTLTEEIDWVVVCPPRASYANDTAVAPTQFDFRFGASAMDTQVTIERPQVFQLYTNARAAPWYIGEDTIQTSNYLIRATGTGVTGNGYPSAGTITAATVATIRLEPGSWSGGNLTFSRVMKKNGVVVSGAFSSAWTYNASGTLTASDTVTFEITATNSFGSETRTLTYTVV